MQMVTNGSFSKLKSIVLVFAVLSCTSFKSMLVALGSNTIERHHPIESRLSLRMDQITKQRVPQLPRWCKEPSQQLYGSYHYLSDDEYTEESPYRQCALPAGKPQYDSTEYMQVVYEVFAYSSVLFQENQVAELLQIDIESKMCVLAGKEKDSHCASELAIPKVALMFLTRSSMPHELLWEKWLGSISGVAPTLCLANAVCKRQGFSILPSISRACSSSSMKSKSAYDQQLLYSVYIHANPDSPVRGPESIFFGRDNLIPRVHTVWGDYSTVEVVKRLLTEALRDEQNQRFVLLSESCVPLYSARIVYQQLMYEKRSRITSCALPSWDRSVERYSVRMAAGREGGRIEMGMWRKHLHWFALLRSHAQLVSNDTEIANTFAQDCFKGYDILSVEPYNFRFCLSDEHYVSTLLAVHGLDAETDCMGRVSSAIFDPKSDEPEHPKSYAVKEINATLFRNLRGNTLESEIALNLSRSAFRKLEEFDMVETKWSVPYSQFRALRPHFYLFARKFTAETSRIVLEVLEKNDNQGERLGILGGMP